VVRVLDLTCDGEIASSTHGRCIAGWPIGQLSLPSLRGRCKSSRPTSLAGVKAGRVHVCRVTVVIQWHVTPVVL